MYKEKYLKYKTKYLDLKSQLGGGPNKLIIGSAPAPPTPPGLTHNEVDTVISTLINKMTKVIQRINLQNYHDKSMLINLITTGQLTLDDVENGITYLNSHYTEIDSIKSTDDWLSWKYVLDNNRPETNTKHDKFGIIFEIGPIYEKRKTGDMSDPYYYVGQSQGDAMGAYK